MSKKAKIILWSVIAAAVIAIVAIVIASIGSVSEGNKRVSNTTLTKGAVSTTVSATGEVASTNSKNIYTSAGYEILEVNVEVGDKVKAGDVLCVIDDFKIKKSIAIAEANLEKSNLSTYNNFVIAERTYKELLETSQGNTTYGQNEATIVKAEQALEAAQENYDDAKADLENIKTSDTYKDTLAAYETADHALRLAEKEYEEALNDIGIFEGVDSHGYTYKEEIRTDYSKEQIVYYENKVLKLREKILNGDTSADYQSAYDYNYDKLLEALPSNIRSIRVSLEGARIKHDQALRSYNDIAKTVQDAYDAAEDNLKNAEIAYKASLKGLDENLADAKAAYELALKNMEDDTNTLELVELNKILDDCVVVAECDGTVTAVNAVEGATAAMGTPLFVVEDTDNLKVKASVKEYDISDISVGQKVEVKSDVFEEEVYEGVVSLVAPAATVAQSYGTSTTPYFAVEVDITSKNTKLLIGMNAKINISTQEVNDVFVLRYDAIGEEDDGNYYVYVAEPGVGETYTAKKVPVQLGLEADMEAEVISSELSEGDIIIMDVDRVKDGETVELKKAKD
ncbi:MAG: HlyD family efflux transporter periplasmic adaptor subunit [Ruminococcus sp.]|nr:HlyD family efflux transporter periplasmic adaptor subunit [Ruminococcus sp.]